MRRLCVICEGQTEAEFVLSTLAPHLLARGLQTYPSILQARSGNHRGGRVTVERLGRHLSHEYHQADRLTTLVDYYGFEDAGGRTRAQLEAAILAAAEKRTAGLARRFVLPYVQMHEFEALLFSDIEQFQFILDGWNEKARASLLAIRQNFACPEDINNSKETAPSKRILSIFNGGEYSKTEHGPIIAAEIGLEKIRNACPGFNEWLARLESWGD